MTYHIRVPETQCKKCSVLVIPFRKNFCCPNCGEPIDDYYDFIPEIVGSMLYHKERYGSFNPPAWFKGSLAEEIQGIVFKLFDSLEQKKPADPATFLVGRLNEADWGDDTFRKYIQEIVLAVYDNYRNNTKFTNPGLYSKLKSRFYRWRDNSYDKH
jgi:hypothetical protein